MKNPIVIVIRLYQQAVSPFLPAACRYTPTCSEYARIAISRHGTLRGGWLAIRRIFRCHPFGSHGVDPVPDAWPGMRRRHSNETQVGR
jgi:hypothetical protein